MYFLVYFAQQVIDKGCLTGTHFARNHGKPLVLPDGVNKMTVCLFMHIAHVKIMRIRVKPERFMFQSVKRCIHGLFPHLVKDSPQYPVSFKKFYRPSKVFS